MLRTVIAVEQDGMNVRALSILFEVPNRDFDLLSAAKAAATDFYKTAEGKELYDYNCSCFN